MAKLGTNLARKMGTLLGQNLASGGSAPPADWAAQMKAAYPLMAHWDIDQGYALNGSTVSAWIDSTPNAYDALQASAPLQPTYSLTSLGGHPGMGDNNGNKYLSGASALAAQFAGKGSCTVLGWARTRSAATFSVLACFGTVASTGVFVEGIAMNTNLQRYNRSGIGGSTNNGATALANATTYSIGSVFDGVSNQSNLYVNGVPEAGNPFTNSGTCNGLDVFLIGARRNSATDGSMWGGLWADLFVIPAVLSASEMAGGHAWLAAKNP